MPFHWSAQVPIHYKRGVVKNELLRAKRISSNFEKEFRRILKTYTSARYPKYIIYNQLEIIESKFNELIPIPDWLFNEIVTLPIRIPYCKKNEVLIRKYTNKLREFTNNNIKITYSWITSKIKSLFPIKDKLSHHHNIIYKGTCNCKQIYIGETGRKEHDRLKGISEPAKHIALNPGHSFTWTQFHPDSFT